MLDSLPSVDSAPSIEAFQATMGDLEMAIFFLKKQAEHWKTVASVQWLLSNLLFFILSVVSLLAYKHVNKALKFYTKSVDYELPKRWLYILWATIVFCFIAITIIPTYVQPDIPHIEGKP